MSDQVAEASQLLSEGIRHSGYLRFDDALDSFDRALSLYRNIQSNSRAADRVRQSARRGEADTLRERGSILIELDDYDAGLADYNQSLAIYRETGNKAQEATTLNSLGVEQYTQRRYAEARSSFEQSLELHRQIENNPIYQQGSLLNNIALTYEAEEDYDNAAEAYGRSIAVYETCLPTPKCEARIKDTLNNIAAFYNETGDREAAIYIYQRLFPSVDSSLRFDVLYSLSTIFYDQGNDALNASEEDPGEYYLQALSYFSESLISIRKENTSRDKRADEALALNSIGILLDELGETELAIVFLKQTVDIYESIRTDNRSLSLDLQQSYFTKFENAYRLLADLLLTQDRVLEAQRVLDLLKLQELDGYMQGVKRDGGSATELNLRNAEAEIIQLYEQELSRLIELGEELARLEKISVAERTNAQKARILELRQLESYSLEKFGEFLMSASIQQKVDQLRRTTEAANVELKELNALRDNLEKLDQDAVVLYPLVLPDRLELVVVTANSAPVRRTTVVDKTELNRVINQLRYALESSTSDAETPAQQLYNWLIRPIENDLAQAGAKTIIYAPDEQLRYIPLPVLHNGNQWLAETYRVQNITAASLADLTVTPLVKDVKVLAAAFTEGQHQVQDLRFDGLAVATCKRNLKDPQTKRFSTHIICRYGHV